MFLHQKTKETGIHNSKKGVGSGKKRNRRSPWWRQVVQRWSSAGQLNFNYNILVAASTNMMGLCDNRGTRDQTRQNSTKTFLGGGGGRWDMGYGPLRVSALVKTAHYRYCYMLSPPSLPCLPNDKVVFTMVSSASLCKIALISILGWFFRFNYYPKPTPSKITLAEAEWRLSANDHHHHHHNRCHHYHHHHYHYGLVRSYMFFLLNSSPQRQLPRLLN